MEPSLKRASYDNSTVLSKFININGPPSLKLVSHIHIHRARYALCVGIHDERPLDPTPAIQYQLTHAHANAPLRARFSRRHDRERTPIGVWRRSQCHRCHRWQRRRPDSPIVVVVS
jgi:hypothetical protein